MRILKVSAMAAASSSTEGKTSPAAEKTQSADNTQKIHSDDKKSDEVRDE